MKGVITNAAEITVLEPIANDYKTGGGPVSVGGCIVISTKGTPFKPVQVFGGKQELGSNLQATFGKPLPKKAFGMEGLRHLIDAAADCNWVQAVRVVNSKQYMYPSISFIHHVDCGAWAVDKDCKPGDVMTDGGVQYLCVEPHIAATAPSAMPEAWIVYEGPVEQNTHRHNEKVLVGEGYAFVLYPVDGDASQNRSVRITKVNAEKKRFVLDFYDKDETGYESRLESFEVGVDPDDKDDMGRPAYMEIVLETQSKIFRCDFLEDLTWDDIEPLLMELEYSKVNPKVIPFKGGTSGGIPENEDWMNAINVFRNESMPMNLFFAAGCYEPDILAEMVDVTDFRHCAFFGDVPPHLNSVDAIAWLKALGIKSRHARFYHAPFSANDPWRGGKTVWGVSGAMAASKARGNAIFSKNVPGVHYSPAGTKRGYLARTGVAQLFPMDIVNRDDLYEARLNPVIPCNDGGAICDDDLVLHYEQNYLRFGWINDVLDYIDHRFVEAASYAKHEPDGLTRDILHKTVKDIMDELVLSGALVKPRQPELDGKKEYVITIDQVEIDLWHVEWAVCITGSARRIAGQPRLIQ